MRVLVVGGTGMVGSRAAKALSENGHEVSVLARNPDAARHRLPAGITIVRGDLSAPGTLASAVAETEAIIISMPLSDGSRRGFVAERDGTLNLLAAIPPAREIPIIKISEIGAGSDPSFFDLDCKAGAEKAIQASGHPFVILRPTWFMEAWPFQLTAMQRFLVVGRSRRRIHWVALDDMASWVVRALERFGSIKGMTLTLQGADALTFAEAGAALASATGRQTLRAPLHGLALAGLFSPRMRTVYELFRYYDREMENFQSGDAWRLLGKPPTTFDAFVKRVADGAYA